MENKILSVWTSILGVFGLSISVEDLSQIFNLILLIVSILNIIIMIGFNCYNIWINKQLNKDEKIRQTTEVVKDGIDQAKEVVGNEMSKTTNRNNN